MCVRCEGLGGEVVVIVMLERMVVELLVLAVAEACV